MVIARGDGGGGASAAAGGAERKRKRGTREKPRTSQWRTEKEHRSYSSKLLSALRLVPAPAPPAPRTRAVRAAADRALAAAARGRTRWSRAILAGGPVRLKARARKPRVPAACAARRTRRPAAEAAGTPAVERKVRVLGRLVPGCRRLQLPDLLLEASDYIAALELQVRAMAALAAALSAAAPPARIGEF